jgi:hypothetical protein
MQNSLKNLQFSPFNKDLSNEPLLAGPSRWTVSLSSDTGKNFFSSSIFLIQKCNFICRRLMIAFYSVLGQKEDVKFAQTVIFGVPSALAALTAKLFLRQ